MIPDRSPHQLSGNPAGHARRRWTIALLVTGAALGVSAAPHNIELWTAVSLAAVFVSAKIAGSTAGLTTTLACVLSKAYAHMSRPERAHGVDEVLYAVLFAAFAALICWFYARLHSAERAMRRSEERFRSLVANAPYAICSCTPDGVLLDVNPAMAAMLRYPAAAQLSQRRLSELYRDPEQFKVLLDDHGMLKQFDAVGAEWNRSDSSSVVVRLAGRPIRDDGEKLFEVVAEDVTERHALEQQFRQAQKMEAIGRLAGGVAHDFNNLLMVISGYSELLLAQLAPESELRRPAEEILHAADRAAALTRQLLAFSRKQVQTPRVLDLNGVVAEHLKMLPRLIGEDIKLIFMPGALSAQVRVDLSQMQQVIMNLAVNARDAMPKGGQLIIKTANVVLDEHSGHKLPNLAAGEYVLLTITDTGIGMNAETQSHLFEPFFTTKGQTGTGLGLSTVYGIVKQSSGYIWAESAPGRGTTFKIYLPHIGEAGQSAQPELPAGRLPQGRETILVVEDEPALRSLARVFLEAHGYTVMEAENGETAIHASRKHAGPIDLLLTDVIMPGMNGRELAHRLISERPKVRVLYISGYADNGNGRNGPQELQATLLEKPFTSATLARKVREVLESPPAVQPTVEPAALPEEIHAEGTRAPRFALRLPLRFRMPGETRWVSATTENVSRSGVLFRTDRQVSPRSPIELQLTLPVEITGERSLDVECRGEVVRTIDAAGNVQSGLAARILEYHLSRGAPVAHA